VPADATNEFQYALLRVVPRVERGESLNAGVIVFSRTLDYLDAAVDLDPELLTMLAPDADAEAIQRQLDGLVAIARGDAGAGAIARMPSSERFHWLVAPSSTVVQPSEVHTGLCDEPARMLDHLVAQLVSRDANGDGPEGGDPRAGLLKEALTRRAHAEADRIRAESAQRAAEQAKARTDFLVDAGRQMASSMDYAATLQRVVSVAVPVLGDWCSITMHEPPGQLQTLAVAHTDSAKTELARALESRYGQSLDAPRGPGRVIRTGEVELIEDITDEMLVSAAKDDDHLQLLRELELRAALVVPLRAPGRVLGALTLIMAESGRRFSPDDIEVAGVLADRAALHIRNAQLYTERSHIARTLQASLLPGTLPEIPGVEVAARYLAAGDQNEVGGDFYDVFKSDGVWTALIGDVAGKGPDAAAVTSLVRHTLRTAALYDADPAENLRTLNRALLEEGEATRFCTVLYVRIAPTPEGAGLMLATGGHLPPRILRADGRLERAEVRGTLVGGVPDAAFGVLEISLGPGDMIVLFTDGVTEIRDRDLGFGDRELDRTLLGLAGASAHDVVDAVVARAVELHGGEPSDDMALIALRVPPRQ
jgi:serine phosphatase RsbU (regulator of sigma subunit)